MSQTTKINGLAEPAELSASKIVADTADNFKPVIERVEYMEEKIPQEDLLSTVEVARALGVAYRTVAKWRERKLFGVPFFEADEKKNGAWFYKRERVEQLRAVYQKGVLQNMYKLARKFAGEEVCPFDICCTSLCKPEPSFFPEDEVAEIIGVDRTTILRWRESRYFVEDMVDHEGCYWYAADRVYTLKAERAGASDKKSTLKSLTAAARQKKLQDNLPASLLRLKRFFVVGGYDKTKGGEWNIKLPTVRWQDASNQKYVKDLQFTDTRQAIGFDIVGHGKGADYLVVDFDHVLDKETGEFVVADAEKWYNFLCSGDDTYREKSISGDGIHFVYKPKAGEFKPMASGRSAKLDFGGDACIELFYKPKGRYFLLTGDVYDCEPKTEIATDASTGNLLDLKRLRGTTLIVGSVPPTRQGTFT